MARAPPISAQQEFKSIAAGADPHLPLERDDERRTQTGAVTGRAPSICLGSPLVCAQQMQWPRA
jgi:hypothetical protein